MLARPSTCGGGAPRHRRATPRGFAVRGSAGEPPGNWPLAPSPAPRRAWSWPRSRTRHPALLVGGAHLHAAPKPCHRSCEVEQTKHLTRAITDTILDSVSVLVAAV